MTTFTVQSLRGLPFGTTNQKNAYHAGRRTASKVSALKFISYFTVTVIFAAS
jgi:hypothetical protein